VTPRVLASTTSHKKEPLVPTLEVFSRLGLRDLDLNLHHVLEDGVPLEAVAGAVAAGNQRVWVASGGWCDFFHRPPRIGATFDSVDRQVGIARRLGAGTLRLFFGRLERDDYGPADLDTIGENLWRLSDRHPEMTFVFENHDGASLDPGICRAILERVNRTNVRMNFDPINFERAGVGAPDALVTLRPFVAHVHLKGLDHGEFCEFGAGEIDLEPVVRSLVEEGYGGQFTVEYEGKSDGTLRLYQSVQRARADLDTLDRHGSRPADHERDGSIKGRSD
jgi:sugar phosphate isomerase/epimerase